MPTPIKRFLLATSDDEKWQLINEMIHVRYRRNTDLLSRNFTFETEEIQLSIVFSMRVIANKRCVPLVEQLFLSHASSVSVTAALCEIVGFLGITSCRRMLLGQLSSHHPEIRFWSCEALGSIGQPEDIPALRALQSDRAVASIDETVAKAATNAIEFIESR